MLTRKRSILRLIPTPGPLNQSIRIFSEDEPRFNEDEVDIIEGEHLFLEQALGWIPEGVSMARNDGNIFTFDDIEKNAQRKSDEASNGVIEPHANNDTVDFGLYVKNNFFNKIGLVDCRPQDQMGRKDYEGPTSTSLDVLNSLSSKIPITKCVGAELFERFKLIAKSDRSNAPYNPGGTCLIPGETNREVRLFRRVMVTLINGS
uniref:Nucleotide-binding alpha-beta plait domain-containing protein n=1 Tax=Tanacetum cinerariifolium TaxID=118510 RepID=A0A6L2NLD6_TANCI|nr:nucleotide-binding alpha-beta plait domain-containing protein [Tanacetum cinerariifolium]